MRTRRLMKWPTTQHGGVRKEREDRKKDISRTDVYIINLYSFILQLPAHMIKNLHRKYWKEMPNVLAELNGTGRDGAPDRIKFKSNIKLK